MLQCYLIEQTSIETFFILKFTSTNSFRFVLSDISEIKKKYNYYIILPTIKTKLFTKQFGSIPEIVSLFGEWEYCFFWYNYSVELFIKKFYKLRLSKK